MHNAGSKPKYKEDNTELRQRKSKGEKSSKSRRKMVGSGSGEPLGQDLADVRMELELDTDGDDTNDEIDTKRLISSSFPDVSIKRSDGFSKGFEEPEEDENIWYVTIQMFIPFLLAGFGMVAASLLLDVVQVQFRNIITSQC